ncbi:MAG: hypothetical protein FWC79_08085 [Oscillospiraceae bacterium]|nr:hypothetical protein [Oscillospiraceae bacterium]
MSSSKNGWEQMPVPPEVQIGISWSTSIHDMWKKVALDFSFVVQVRNFSIMFNRTSYKMSHIIIKKFSFTSSSPGLPKSLYTGHLNPFPEFEPTYADKKEIQKVVGFSGLYALEVFPSTEKLIDETNLFHMWILPEEFQMPTIPTEIKVSLNFENLKYGISSFSSRIGDIIVAKIENNKPGVPIPWMQKQKFKNKVFGEAATAVEFMPDDVSNIQHTYLLCLPENFELPFCLND